MRVRQGEVDLTTLFSVTAWLVMVVAGDGALEQREDHDDQAHGEWWLLVLVLVVVEEEKEEKEEKEKPCSCPC